MKISGYTVTSSPVDGKAVMLDYYTGSPALQLQTNVSGSVTYTVQQATILPNATTGILGAPASTDWFNIADAAMVNSTSSAVSTMAIKPSHIRVTTSSGAGSVTLRFIEFGSGEG